MIGTTGLGQTTDSGDLLSGMNFPKTPIGWLLPPGVDETLVIGGAAFVLLLIGFGLSRR